MENLLKRGMYMVLGVITDVCIQLILWLLDMPFLTRGYEAFVKIAIPIILLGMLVYIAWVQVKKEKAQKVI